MFCIQPECQKTLQGDGWNVYLGQVIGVRNIPMHPSWPINVNLCPADHGLESQLGYPHGLHIPQPLSLPTCMHISQASGMAYM